ncbi:universal stress protein [Marinobacter mobilis]|uniref:Nucleotide-binding universal stress protein, UspA family n=1 Tax=Marinobacter mobilis TaxID=488533 RepID=A0A1H2WHN9_9GAMM|nr:universal stress protein [Marinobacter mobilis]SDW80067.1 Nucleotide-binding universal stress protein, UspA family [Marinobacter mobilis]
MRQVVGCIDGSRAATAVCDYAAWACQRLETPLTLFHVLDQERYPAETDLAGSIGLGSREHLLQELAELDQRRSRVAMEQGRHMLEAAEQRVREQGVSDVHLRQRHGDLTDSLLAIEDSTRLLVMGLHGESSSDRDIHIGSQLETVIRSVHRPVMLVPDEFTEPRSALFAFDGSPTTLKALEMLAQSPILKGLPVHVVMIGADTGDRHEQLKEAERALAALDSDIHLEICAGDVETALHRYQQEQGIDLLIMGAYGHSRIRQFLVGSTTTHMLKTSATPLIILR